MNIRSGFTRRNIGRAALLAITFFSGVRAGAQDYADKIILVVGKEIVLQSELEMEVAQIKQQNPGFSDSMKCQLVQSMIMRKIFKAQAERDSVMVSEEDVEGQLDNRLRYFVQMYGSKEKLEQMSGKTIYQIKEENRDGIRDQMIAEKMQNQVLGNTRITPAEVDAFYKKIPPDSLPFFPAIVEVGQIVIDPPVSQELDDYAKEKLAKIRQEIVGGSKSFEIAAGLYSDDPGSRDAGGRYDGITRNGGWAPEFIAAAFKLQDGEISPIIKTKFGYHIIQMIHRKGDEADVRHILVKPEVTSADFKKAMAQLDSVRNLLVTGKITFPEAVGKFSTDEAAKRTGGMIADPQTGNAELDMTKLDAGMVMMLDSMKPGDYSSPQMFLTESHDRSCRIVYLRTRTAPHKANLKDDYSRIQEVALAQKKNTKLQNWIKGKIPTFYIKVAPEYQGCLFYRQWGLDDMPK